MLIIVLIAIIIAIIVNKGLRGIEHKKVEQFYLILLGFAIQLVIFSREFSYSKLNFLTPILYIYSLLILLIFMVLNLQYKGIKIAGIGFLSNLVAIVSNGGYMPQDLMKIELVWGQEKVELLKQTGHFNNAISMSPNTHLNFLGDIIAIPKPKFLMGVYSVGDVFITIGIAIFIFEFLKFERNQEEIDEEDFIEG
jgi:membrane-associated HD superfamily phosphohydrolase